MDLHPHDLDVRELLQNGTGAEEGEGSGHEQGEVHAEPLEVRAIFRRKSRRSHPLKSSTSNSGTSADVHRDVALALLQLGGDVFQRDRRG